MNAEGMVDVNDLNESQGSRGKNNIKSDNNNKP